MRFNKLFVVKFSYYHLILACCVFTLNFVLQAENSLKLVTTVASSRPAETLLFLLVGQSSQLVFAVLLLLLFSLTGRSVFSGWVVFFLTGALLIYLNLNQLFYGMYFDHFRIGFDPEGQAFSIVLLKDSLLAVIDIYFYVNLLATMILVLCCYRSMILWRSRDISVKLSLRKAGLIFMCFSAYALTGGMIDRNVNNTKNPFFVLAESVYMKYISQSSKEVVGEVGLSVYNPIFSEKRTLDIGVDKYFQSTDTVKKPNIIYIVLESVGATTMLDANNQISRSVTPNIFAWKNKMLLFPWIYNTYPATSRSHVPIMTGGHTITYDSFSTYIGYKYKGPSLPSELKRAGYSTALFTSQFMDFGALDSFYLKLPFDHRYMPEQLDKTFTNKHKLNSWGIDEREPYLVMKDWISKNKKGEKPFFIEFMNVGTHHPYTAPAGYTGPFLGDDNFTKYKNALHYTDFILGEIISELKVQGLYDNTIICISGDHGQAFGKVHYKNLFHKNFLYEENVRNFLIIIDPRKTDGYVVSRKKAFIGDIMPSIASFAGRTVKNIPGQNLFSPSYQNRIHYFHKIGYPDMWGLKDGSWKFIVEKLGSKNPELYNLERDPKEQNNLALKYPERVAQYQKMLPSWYINTNKLYRNNLQGYRPDEEFELRESDLTTSGPKYMAFGNMNQRNEFLKKNLIHPKESFFVRIKLVPYPEDARLNCIWISPSGQKWDEEFYVEKDWVTAWKSFERKSDPEEGVWECRIMKDDKLVISEKFTISRKAALVKEYFYKKGPVRLFFGIKDSHGFIALDELHPDESSVVFAQINPYDDDRELLYEWVSPSGTKYSYSVLCKAGWNYTWLLLNEGLPMEEGTWKMKVSQNGSELLKSTFNVSHEAKLHLPNSMQK